MVFKRFFLLTLVLALAATGAAQVNPVSKAQSDLVAWGNIMEMFVMDDGHYPEAASIEALAQEVFGRLYWEEPVITDPSGRPYTASSRHDYFRIATADGSVFIEKGFKVPVVIETPKPKSPTPSPSLLSIPTPRSPDTSLYVTKSGNDIRLDWTGSGTQYDGAVGTGPQFYSVRTLFVDSTASSYLYANGLLKTDETFLCFDVTDEVEQNHGGYWNGGVLPPPPPTINAGSPTNIGSLYDGSTGTIAGTGFSTNPAENIICFDGGVCIPATTATATQISFTTPPGAVSGDLTVQVGAQSSDPATAFVTLEDPAIGWLIRTIGYSPLTAEYWMAGNGPAGYSIYRVYYDPGTKKWLKSDQIGGMSPPQSLACSGQTSNTGRLFCGYFTVSTAGGTRYVDTSPPGTLTPCIGLGSGSNVNVRGAAMDPNPNDDPSRRAGYFAFVDTGTSNYRVKKVAADCSSVLDADYGNMNWNTLWGTTSLVGMTVDPVTGDLYVGAKDAIQKVEYGTEAVSLVKGGFTNIFGLDIFRQSSGDPGFFLAADAGTAGAGTLKAFALDNTAAPPLTVAAVTNMRTVNWGGSVFSQTDVIPGNAIRRVVVHNNNNGGPVLPVRTNPLIGVSPGHSSDLWISAPLPEGGSASGPAAQAYTRASDPLDTTYSRGRFYMWYKDDKARYTCAYMGDPGKAAVGYEPDPADPNLCDKPCLILPCTLCDNKDAFAADGVGVFQDTLTTKSCKMCGSFSNRCYWEFRITQRYGGDNYKIYFRTDDFPSTTYFANASPSFTAVKHFHEEPDKMCRNGGIIGINAGVGATQIYLSKLYNPDTLQWDRVDTVADDNQIAIFDADRPFEGPHDTAYALITNPDFVVGNLHYVEVSLKVAPGGVASPLQYSYTASTMQAADPFAWTFDNGKSAGVCVQDNLYYQSDSSALPGAYNDAFMSFHTPAYGTEGSGVVPYLPPAMADICAEIGDCANPDWNCGAGPTWKFAAWRHFGRIWFSKRDDQSNIVQVIGVGRAGQFLNCTICGGTRPMPNFMAFSDKLTTAGGPPGDPATKQFVNFIQSHEDYCMTPAQTANSVSETHCHEWGHQCYANSSQPQGHDTKCSWENNTNAPPYVCPTLDPGTCNAPGSATACLMNPNRDRWNLHHRFDANDLTCGDPACPTGNPGCCPACALPGNGAIRQIYDPILP